MNMKNLSVRRLVRCAVIAAVYVVVCLVLAPFSYGAVQVRVAEALCLLPVFGAEYIVGVTLGCFLANLLGSTVVDVVFGTLATLIAAVLTWRMRANIWVRALPPVLCNAVIVGLVLTYAYGIDMLWMNMLTVGLGEAVVCYVLGVPMIKLLSRQDLSRWQA